MSALLWPLIAGAPILAGCALLMFGRQGAGSWLWIACVPALLAALLPPPAAGLPYMWPGAGLEMTEQGRLWLGFTALLWACATAYAAVDLRGDQHSLRFWAFWILAMSGNFLLLIAADVGTFYVGFSMMSLAGYGLIVHLGGPRPRQAGRIYLQLAILGELLLFSGIMLRVHQGSGEFGLVALQEVATSPFGAALLLIGLGLKAGFWPLHMWLPLAHPAAPAGASAVLSGAMIKAGIYGLWRLLPAEDPLLQEWAPALLAVAFVSMFYGVGLGVMQSRPKTVLAYSSVSQMGYLLAILSLSWLHPDGRAAMGVLLGLFALHHGLAKGALFMGAGLASHFRLSTLQWLALAVPALALAGLPLTSGGAVKLIFKEAMEHSFGPLLVVTLSLGSAGTSLLMLRAFWLMRHSSAHHLPSPPAAQWVPWVLLCLSPLLVQWMMPDLRQHSLYALTGAAWSLIWPALLGAGLAYAALRGGARSAPLRACLPSPTRMLSLQLKRLIQPRLGPSPPPRRSPWRAGERLLNRLAALEPVSTSGWVLLLMLLVGWVMAL